MRSIDVICPCCGHNIHIELVSDGTVIGVVSDTNTDYLVTKLSDKGLEFGVVEGGESEHGQ